MGFRLRHKKGLWLHIEKIGRGVNDQYTPTEDDATEFSSKEEIKNIAKRLELQRKDFEIV